MNQNGLDGVLVNSATTETSNQKYAISDVYAYIQNKAEVTRTSIFNILKLSGRVAELEINPQQFLDVVVSAMQQALRSLLVDGIQYQRLETKIYEQSLLDEDAIETYLSSIFPRSNDKVAPLERTLYTATPIDEAGKVNGGTFNCVIVDDSEPERNFAEDCNTMGSDKLKFYFKLPSKFKIPTPAGNYNPDWAVVADSENRVYFVAETKSHLSAEAKRGLEQLKLEYAKRYFELKEFADDGVAYKVVTKASELN